MRLNPNQPKTGSEFHSDETANPNAHEVKIAYIGGGSRSWAMHLMEDLALSANLKGELRLYDIDYAASQHNEMLGTKIFAHPDARGKFAVRAVRTLSSTLIGADFVVISIEPGPTTMRYADLEIPAKYGVLQTVGDTTGPGGLLRSLRTVPLYIKIAEAIMEHCPKAWVINYTNPMAVCTATLFSVAPRIKALGCCHEVFGTQRMLARHIPEWFGVEQPREGEIDLDLTGVNHFTWATKATWRGHDLLQKLGETIAEPEFFRSRKREAEQAIAKQAWFDRGLVAYDLFRRFGALGAAGDRHLAEFVPWYLSSEAELHRWGVVMTPYSWRLERTMGPRKSIEEVGEKLSPSGEEGVLQIEALLGIRTLVTNVNVANVGQISSLPKGTIVETYAEFRQDSIVPLIAGELPLAAQALVCNVATEQTMTLQAALTGDRELAFQALLTHPLVRISTDSAWKMFQEMLEATQEMLPQFKKSKWSDCSSEKNGHKNEKLSVLEKPTLSETRGFEASDVALPLQN